MCTDVFFWLVTVLKFMCWHKHSKNLFSYNLQYTVHFEPAFFLVCNSVPDEGRAGAN